MTTNSAHCCVWEIHSALSTMFTSRSVPHLVQIFTSYDSHAHDVSVSDYHGNHPIAFLPALFGTIADHIDILLIQYEFERSAYCSIVLYLHMGISSVKV